DHLFGTCGFRGNTQDYYDPRNSFLNDVLDRRTGIPISLSVVFIEVTRRLGLPVEGVGFPGHFLVRVAGRRGPILLDPFFGGRPASPPTGWTPPPPPLPTSAATSSWPPPPPTPPTSAPASPASPRPATASTSVPPRGARRSRARTARAPDKSKPRPQKRGEASPSPARGPGASEARSARRARALDGPPGELDAAPQK